MISRRWFRIGVFIFLFVIGPRFCALSAAQMPKNPGKEESLGGPGQNEPALPPGPPSSVPSTARPLTAAPPSTGSSSGGSAAAPRPVRPELPRDGRFVLNFDNADLHEVIRVMADMLKITYTVDPRVKGTVNIHTSGQIGSGELFPIFQSILRLNGAVAVQRGTVHEIIPFAEARKAADAPVAERGAGRGLAQEKFAIQVVPLRWVQVSEISKTIKPFLSDGAELVEHVPQNILIIADVASNLKKALDIIDLFDTDFFAGMGVRLYPIIYSDVIDVARDMERLFGSFDLSLKSGRGVGITITPIPRINSLLVVSGIPQVFDKVEQWLKDLDKMPGAGSKLSAFVYYVQNGRAKEMAEVLRQVFVRNYRPGTSPGTGTTGYGTSGVGATGYGSANYGGATSGTALSAAQQRLSRPLAPGGAEAPLPPGGLTEGEISIVVDEATNSLIIRAFQRDYNTILETVKKLDLYPKQVLIEVMLAEVTLDKNTQFGLEFSTFQDSFSKGSTTYNQTFGMGGTAAAAGFTSGMRYAISATDKLMAAIRASATDSRLKVISSPHILASNNKEAKIQVGTSQPILTNTYTTTATGTPGVVEGTIEYKDTGIILTVTPRVSDGGLVSLDVNVENSSVQFAALGNLNSVPFFNKKTAKTTLAIMGGQTIVIGGLIAETRSDSSSGVPFLSRIPILGGLFGYQTYARNKTETLLLLTPHVIDDMHQSNAVTKEFQDKVQSIKKEVELGQKRMK